MKGGPFGEKKILGKKSPNAEKLKGGTLWGFSTSNLSQNSKKIEGDPLEKFFFRKKSLTVPKKMKGGPFGLARYGMLRGKPFSFSSLGQIVQFGAIIFCRTFLSVHVDRKKGTS